MHRNDLGLRRVTTLGSVLPDDAINKAKSFIKNANQVGFKYQNKSLFALDQVKATTAGCEKTKLSVFFCATSDGNKSPTLRLLPRKRPLKNFVVKHIIFIIKSAIIF